MQVFLSIVLSPFGGNRLHQIETNHLFKRIVISSSDTPYGQFVRYLNNFDWINAGYKYIQMSDHQCPFCELS